MPRDTRKATRPSSARTHRKADRKITVTGDPKSGFDLSTRRSREQARKKKKVGGK